MIASHCYFLMLQFYFTKSNDLLSNLILNFIQYILIIFFPSAPLSRSPSHHAPSYFFSVLGFCLVWASVGRVCGLCASALLCLEITIVLGSTCHMWLWSVSVSSFSKTPNRGKRVGEASHSGGRPTVWSGCVGFLADGRVLLGAHGSWSFLALSSS